MPLTNNAFADSTALCIIVQVHAHCTRTLECTSQYLFHVHVYLCTFNKSAFLIHVLVMIVKKLRLKFQCHAIVAMLLPVCALTAM